MKVSFKLSSVTNNIYEITLSSIDESIIDPELKSALRNLEIVEVFLDRISGNNITEASMLSRFSDIIANMFAQNSNIVFYFFCDDLNEIPNLRKSRRKISVQEYRSRLFHIMFTQYCKHHGIDNYRDNVIHFIAIDRPYYLHLISRDTQDDRIEIIKEFIKENYMK